MVLIVRRGKREVPVELHREQGTPATNETFDAEFGKEINARAEANVDASEREDSGSEGLQRENSQGKEQRSMYPNTKTESRRSRPKSE